MHIACHGELDSGLCLSTAAGWSCPIDAEDLLRLLRRSRNLRCIVLAACQSDRLAQTLSAHIEVAIGFEGPVNDDAARAFARGFWSTLSKGLDISEAFADGRLNLQDRAQVKLFTKPGINARDIIPLPK